jgi:hypothetical protein
MHKYITIPADVILKDRVSGDAGQTVSFKQFAVNALMMGQAWGGGYAGISALKRVDDEIQTNGAAGQVMKLTVADWEKLNKAVDGGSEGGGYVGFHPLAVIQMMVFLDAIKGAADKDPSEAPKLESVKS